jgi:hypothetical protein
VSCFKVEPLYQIGHRKPPKLMANGDHAPSPANGNDRPFDDRIPF